MVKMFCWMVLCLLPTAVLCQKHYEYIVVGAGPAGLQMGYFLQRAGRDFIILEKSNTAGDFFSLYPRHDQLISINKRYTGQTNKEFNLRHDWNSLLSDDDTLLFGKYSRDYFPQRDSLLHYFRDYAGRLRLRIQYNTTVGDVRQERGNNGGGGGDEDVVTWLTDQNGEHYSCKYLLLATGIWKPNKPNFTGLNVSVGYEELDLNPETYEGKSVLILGHGNAAFETADAIYPHANLVHLASRSRVRLAWETHYVGDLRAVNNNLLDTYQLKSLDGVLEGSLDAMQFAQQDDGSVKVSLHADSMTDNFAMREKYDIVLRCLGFQFDMSIFNPSLGASSGEHRRSKYPKIQPDYQLHNVSNVYVLGAASHSLDWRKSAGGFIHGFRYTVRSLHRLLEERNHGAPWPHVQLPYTSLLTHILKRINEASAIYQMFGVLVDVISIRPDHVEYFEEIPLELLPNFTSITSRPIQRCIVLMMQYGAEFSKDHADVFRSSRATAFAHDAHHSNFLHPVLYYYRTLPTANDFKFRRPNGQVLLPEPTRLHHMVEDFLTRWMSPGTHVVPLRRFLEVVTRHDLRAQFAETCFVLSLTHKHLPVYCEEAYGGGGDDLWVGGHGGVQDLGGLDMVEVGSGGGGSVVM